MAAKKHVWAYYAEDDEDVLVAIGTESQVGNTVVSCNACGQDKPVILENNDYVLGADVAKLLKLKPNTLYRLDIKAVEVK